MDAIDLRILALLAGNARMTFSELAEQIGLSGPSTADRVRRLEERGAIRGYAAVIDPDSLGLGLTAFIAVTLGGPGARDGVPRTASPQLSQVVECHHVAGDDDYLLKVHVAGTRGLEEFVSDRIKALPGIARTRTTVVLSTPLDRPLAPGEPGGVAVSTSLALFARTFVIGIAVAAPVGAMGVLCIQRTLAHGWRAGLATGAGIATADGIYAGLAAFGVSVVSAVARRASDAASHRRRDRAALAWLAGDRDAAGARRCQGASMGPAFGPLYASAVGLTFTNPTTIMAFAAVFASAGLVAQPGAGHGR